MTSRADVAAPAVVRLGAVESTQAVAFSLAERGAADGTVVVAETQTAGRGRRGRVWHDEPGASLLASIVLRPALPPTRLPLLSLTAAVAVACALARVGGVEPRLKWPNDVLVDGRKIAGILLESRGSGLASRGSGGAPSADRVVVVVGIGINLLQRQFPPDLEDRATSLLRATGRAIDRETVLTALVAELDRWRARLEAGDFAAVREEWRRRADTLGRTVTVDGATGVAVDLDGDGALVLAAGERTWRVTAGEIG